MKNTLVAFLMGEWFEITREGEHSVKVTHVGREKPENSEVIKLDELPKAVGRQVWLQLREFCRKNGTDQQLVERYFAFLDVEVEEPKKSFNPVKWFTDLLAQFTKKANDRSPVAN